MRNKEQSDAITSGQHGPKLPGLGRAPTSGVCGLWPQRHCLPFLSRIRDNFGYTESWIIPNILSRAPNYTISVKKFGIIF